MLYSTVVCHEQNAFVRAQSFAKSLRLLVNRGEAVVFMKCQTVFESHAILVNHRKIRILVEVHAADRGCIIGVSMENDLKSRRGFGFFKKCF